MINREKEKQDALNDLLAEISIRLANLLLHELKFEESNKLMAAFDKYEAIRGK